MGGDGQPGTALSGHRLEKVYQQGRRTPPAVAVAGIDLEVRTGELVAVMGPSGSGKSTLMHLLAGLDRPTRGEVHLGGERIDNLNDRQLTRIRREKIGFVFQSFNLLPGLTALENITLPLRLAHRRPDRAWLEELVERTGLTGRLKHRPAELSGGQAQRVAVARALLPRPDVVFADEPTGNLDTRTGTEILDLLHTASHHYSQTVVMVTHDPAAAARCDRVVLITDGKVSGEVQQPDLEKVLDATRHHR